MLNPGDKSLCDQQISTPLDHVALTPVTDLEGMSSVTLDFRFLWGSGGTKTQVYVQTTVDGTNWLDIACLAFTTASDRRVLNLRADALTTPTVPTDGAMADNTVLNGPLGSALRVKLNTTGTYANTTISVKADCR